MHLPHFQTTVYPEEAGFSHSSAEEILERVRASCVGHTIISRDLLNRASVFLTKLGGLRIRINQELEESVMLRRARIDGLSV
jgi:hypothetical protein